MRIGKVILMTVLMAILCVGGTVGDVLAGNPPPAPGTIVGPEIWGVMIIDASGVLSLRVKRIDDCDVETQSLVDITYSLGAPDVNNIVGQKLTGRTFFDINPDPAVLTPIITKVKNFKQEPAPNDGWYSFDVQIKFEQQ